MTAALSSRIRAALILFAVTALVSAGCGEDTPTSPTPTASTPVTEMFIGTLPMRGTVFYSYGVRQPGGDVSITLASVTYATAPVATDTALEIGIGVPSGEGCSITQATIATAALRPQLTPGQASGIYCVSVTDPGTLTQPANFGVRIVHP